MLRSKPLSDGSFDHNSYCSPDSVNSLKWDDLNQESYRDVYEYYKGLIAFRKAHPALRMTSAEDVSAYISNLPSLDFNVAGFRIAAGAGGEEQDLIVIYNPRTESTDITLPEGKWNVFVDGDNAGTKVLSSAEGTVSVAPISAMVLVQASETEFPFAAAATALGAAVLALVGVIVWRRKSHKK